MCNLKKMLYLSTSCMILGGSINAYALDNHLAPPNTLALDTSILEPSSSYQLAAVTWLPDVKDSEVGPTGSKWDNMSPKDKDCTGYPYTAKNCNSGNRELLGERCPYDSKYYKSCGCNTSTYPISSIACRYDGTLHSQEWLLGGTVCKDGRADKASMYGKKCLCTSSNFRYTTKESCPAPQTVLDTVSSCTANGVTRYERCKCDTSAGQYDSDRDKGEGYLCSSCNDEYGTHYKCQPVPCPTGQYTGKTNGAACDGGVWKETTNRSGEQKCYRCEDISNCDFFKNADGNISVPEKACSWRVYGHYSTTTLPADKSYGDSWVNMWGNSTVKGAFTTNKLAVGGACSSSGYCEKSPRTITFEDLVVVNDVIEYDPFTTMVFKKGVCGNFTCQEYPDYRYSKTGIKTGIKQGQGKCPTAKTSGCPEACKKFYVNTNGSVTVPSGYCEWRVYGNYATITVPKESYKDSWANLWGNSTVKGEFTTEKLAVGGACSSTGSCSKSPRTITFDSLVTVTNVIEYDPFTTLNFKKGVGGNFTCQEYPDYRYSKTGIKTGIKQGQGKCPCSVTRFIYNSSNCNGTLSGESCGGKYETCIELTPAEKCEKEGYHPMSYWNSLKPTASLNMPSLTGSKFAYILNNIIGIKSAQAANLPALNQPELSQGCPASMVASCKVNCTANCQKYFCCGLSAGDNITIKPVDPTNPGLTVPVTPSFPDEDELPDGPVIVGGNTYTFNITARCPYDSTYVKGEWVKTSGGSSGGGSTPSCTGQIAMDYNAAMSQCEPYKNDWAQYHSCRQQTCSPYAQYGCCDPTTI